MASLTSLPEEHIKVWCRLRGATPQDEPEEGTGAGSFLTGADEDGLSCFEEYDSTTGEVVYRRGDGGGDGKRFRVDGLLNSCSSQEETFSAVGAAIVDGCLEGFNGAVLAYGQTGSGKTHSMRGSDDGPDAGMIPRALERLIAARDQALPGDITLSFSAVQIYCEMLHDLLDPQASAALTIRDSSSAGGNSVGNGVYVQGLSKHPIPSLAVGMQLLRSSDANRAVAATKLNATSSRSHAAYLIHVERRDGSTSSSQREGSKAGGSEQPKTFLAATLTMVDLAGSERVKKSGVQYQALEESKAINLSLSALGNCVSSLAQNRSHVPYRDSKLTRLLSQSLGGNAKTALLVALAPGSDLAGENLSSLQFASRAGKVRCAAVRNERVDYAQLYATAQAALDAREDKAHALELLVANLQEKLASTEERARKAEASQRSAEELLGRTSAGYQAAMDAMKGPNDHDGEGRGEREGGNGDVLVAAAVQAVNEKWEKELKSLQASHNKHTAALSERWEDQLAAYKDAAAHANAEWNQVETDLTSERHAYLEALQDLRELRGQHTAMEKEHANRTAELLATLTEAKEREEELVEALGSAQSTADLSLRKASELAERLEALEDGKSVQAAERDQNWVSRSQVEAMDQMFKETVEKLSARLEVLASQNQRLAEQQEVQVALGGGVRSMHAGPNEVDRNQRLNASSRAALGDLERRHNPLRMGGGVGGGGGGGMRVGEENNGRGSGAARQGPAGGGAAGVGGGGGGRNVRIEPGKLRARGGGAVGGNPFAPPQRRF